MNFKKAFTLAELMMVIAISGTILLITTSGYKGANEYLNNIKLKNISIEFKHGLNSLITSELYYPGNNDLTNTKEIRIHDPFTNTEKIHEGESKFRGLFLQEIKVLETNPKDCYMINDSTKAEIGNCYKGSNNIAWGIPDTDFNKINVVFASDASGSVYKYVPITIYPANSKHSTLDDFERYAIIYGVRSDGDITIINTVDCEDSMYKNYNQCKMKEIISSSK